ncbi:hypothetical protein N7495_000103 [Penicillium taxi]|uniref:uncharacterized protein n=1 Tax=Penicillium taxi TaxID=168475 RepID=UPI002544FB5A|nr:uncharacterized protein N7495_000103 [Penicillium taxi]KAJ5907421.1 hypothetical protein N7495_000103 [Penicillium taxi]
MPPSQSSGDRNGGTLKSFSLKPNGASAKPFSHQSSRGRPSHSSLPSRPHQLSYDDDSSDEEHVPVHEEVVGFDTHTGGAVTADELAVKEKGPLVIPVTSKNNWRDRPGTNVRKGKNILPPEVQAMQEAQRNGQVPGPAVETSGPSMAYGLSFAQKSAENEMEDATANEDLAIPDAQPPINSSKPLTEDEIALQALLRETTGEVERRTDLVIEASKLRDEEDGAPSRYDEASSFRTDVASRPDPATLDQYNAIPVEEFGAALLRGMGWKDGQSIGRGDYSGTSSADRKQAKKASNPTPRPGFLGIGAKDTSGGKGAEVELGAWGKSAMRKASRRQGEENGGTNEGVYMPVMMRNKKTGEQITEEELAEMKKEAAKSQPDKDDWRERRDRNLDKSGRDRDYDRDRDRNRDRDGNREYRKRDYEDERSDRRGFSRRDRSRSSGRHSSRRSRYDDDRSDRRSGSSRSDRRIKSSRRDRSRSTDRHSSRR